MTSVVINSVPVSVAWKLEGIEDCVDVGSGEEYDLAEVSMFGGLEGVAQRFFFSSRRRHTRFGRDWSSDVCSSDLKKYIW